MFPHLQLDAAPCPPTGPPHINLGVRGLAILHMVLLTTALSLLGKAHGITPHECYTTRLGAFLHRAHARVPYHGLGEISLDTFRLIKIDLPRLSLTSIFS